MKYGTSTDANGYFSIELPDGKKIILEASFLGMKPCSVEYAGQKEIQMVMQPDANMMESADAALFWEAAAVIAVFLTGAVVGILSFSKFLRWLLSKWHKGTLLVLAGFIVGSLVKIWPWNNPEALMQVEQTGGLQVGWAVVFALMGFGLVFGIEIATSRRS